MGASHQYSTFAEIEQAHKDLNATFLSSSLPSLSPSSPTSTSPHAPFSLPYRIHQLHQLALLAQQNANALCSALATDLGKPKREVLMAEIGPVIERTLACADKVGSWVQDEEPVGTPEWQKGWKGRVEKKAKGVVLIISPWNYPIILTFQPLYGAISAGCAAVLKPSEIVPTFSALLASLVPKYLDPAAYRVITGGVPEITHLLKLKWDHIFYTGNGKVGRIISAAAAKHLTPLTLELGGKSPVIVDADSCGSLEIAAKRIMWGKVNNAGQICIAPDYVLIPHAHIPAFTTALSLALSTFFPSGALSSPDYGRIVSPLHFTRITSLLSRTTGRIVLGGKTGKGGDDAKERGVEPTVVVFESLEEAEKDALMEEELFAPILPVVGVRDVREALAFVRRRDHPLVIYAFTEDEEVKKAVSASTMSGNLVFNDTFQQLSSDVLPFGGVGESGYGRQVVRYTFDEFVYQRAVVDIPQSDEPFFGLRYPPTTPENLAFFSQALSIPIPGASSTANGEAAKKVEPEIKTDGVEKVAASAN